MIRPAAVVVGLLLVAVAACSGPQDSPARPRVVVGVQSFVTFSPFYLAEALGYFEDEGLDVELSLIASGEHGLAQLVSGDLDVMSGFPGAGLLNLIGRGADIRLVADRGYMPPDHCSYYSLLVRTGIEPGAIPELIGRTARVDPALPSFWLDKLLVPAGYSIADLNVVDFPASGIPGAFDSGAIDIVMIGDPWRLQLIESGRAYEWASVKDWAPDTQFALVFYGSRLIRERPEVGERFMVAYLRAVQQFNLGPTEHNLDLLVERLGQPRETLQATCWLPVRPDGRSELSFLDEFQDWAVQQGLLDQRVAAEKIWDSRFVDYAARRLAAGTAPALRTSEPERVDP